jgi:hypothetical protein
MASEFLQSVIRWNIDRNGSRRLLPYLYYDIAWIAGIYTASTAIVRELLPSRELRPIELIPGRALIAIAFFDYKELDHEPYRETSISFLVQYRKRPIPAAGVLGMIRSKVFPTYIWQLPVTSEYHCSGGVDLFGYPKFMAEIEFQMNEVLVECTLSISGIPIVHLAGHVLPVSVGPRMRFETYTAEGDTLIMANAIVNPLQYAESRRKRDLSLEIGRDHAICETLRNIKLSSHPLLYQFSPRGESILFPGRNILDT